MSNQDNTVSGNTFKLETLSDRDLKNLKPLVYNAIKESLYNLSKVNITDRMKASAVTDEVMSVLFKNLKGN